MKSVSTVIVGQRDMLRAGFIATLRSSRFKIVREFTNSLDLESAATIRKTAALLLVIEPVGRRDDTQRAIQLARATDPKCCIAVVSQDREDIAWAFAAGADGCLPRTISPSALLMALDLLVCREVGVGTFFMASSSFPTSPLLPEPPLTQPTRLTLGISACEHLSQRERQVLDCVAKGESNKRIARHLAIGEATVKGHVRTVLRKIGATNRTQAAVWAHALLPFSPQGSGGTINSPIEALPH